MKTAPVTDVKNRLSHFLRLVARGETVTITDHGRPVARLSRVEIDTADAASLVAEGLARAPLAPLPSDFTRRRLPRADIRRTLVEDREDRF